MASNDTSGSSSVISVPSATMAGPSSSGGNGYTYQHAAKSIWVAMVVNFVIAAIKFIAWLFTHSSAMLSEALHSLGDGINSIALLIGIQLSSRPPDRTHPYGYGLEASVWAIPACAFLLIFSGLSVYEGWERLQTPEAIQPLVGGLVDPFIVAAIILVISIGLEIVAVSRACDAVLEELGLEVSGFTQKYWQSLRHIKQVIGPTTRFVFYEDSIALLGAVIALIAISMSRFAVDWGYIPKEIAQWPDAIASMLIGLMMVTMSGYLFFHNRSILTGTAATPRIEKKIMELVLGIHGVSEVHDLKTIDRGPAGLTINMKVEVEPETMVKDVDDLTDRIKDKLHSRMPNISTIAIEVLADESDIEWGEKFNTLIDQGRNEGILKPREESILRNFHDFLEATAEDVMIPRTDVVAVEINTALSEVADSIIEHGHSRLPVYEDSMDQIRGIVYARDVFNRIRQNQMDAPLGDLLQPVDIFPENKPVSDLLEDFKRRKIQIAIVADEHGGFAGIVTVEDLLEEIVGDIWDTHDEEDLEFELTGPSTLVISGKYDIEELNEKLDLQIPTDEFLTVGGYVFGTLGREPQVGDTVSFEDMTITVLEMDGHRVDKIQLDSPVPFELQKPENIEQPPEAGT